MSYRCQWEHILFKIKTVCITSISGEGNTCTFASQGFSSYHFFLFWISLRMHSFCWGFHGYLSLEVFILAQAATVSLCVCECRCWFFPFCRDPIQQVLVTELDFTSHLDLCMKNLFSEFKCFSLAHLFASIKYCRAWLTLAILGVNFACKNCMGSTCRSFFLILYLSQMSAVCNLSFPFVTVSL